MYLFHVNAGYLNRNRNVFGLVRFFTAENLISEGDLPHRFLVPS